MNVPLKKVFVLGAGFTKAFAPDAPQMVDDYSPEIRTILRKLGQYEHVTKLLKVAQGGDSKGRIDIERLFTRLDGQMPYDIERGHHHELGLLLSELKRAFVQRIEKAKKSVDHASLNLFANHCLATGSTCVTFNYDDVLDEEIWEAAKKLQQEYVAWGPDGGYGFFCKPSTFCVQSEGGRHVDVTKIKILKLHGSINWRVRRGYSPPYSIDAIVHHEAWFKPLFQGKLRTQEDTIKEELILNHLQVEPFIVPPVLTKLSLIEQPILRLVWTHAYQALAEADQIVFIGYSMPITDMAASFLFTESLATKKPKVLVIDLSKGKTKQSELMSRYRRSIPKTINVQFEFKDARKWVENSLATSS